MIDFSLPNSQFKVVFKLLMPDSNCVLSKRSFALFFALILSAISGVNHGVGLLDLFKKWALAEKTFLQQMVKKHHLHSCNRW